jgi:RHH-type proline utilization regulon transcriptional repressor/proline dehydrogenase/delta 1-pyrroline-5-carboxylate dehydrogenase
MEPLFADPKLAEWNGLGLAVQAYSKRALPLIDWLASVAEATGRRIPVRLVKGAYWDSEIKWAQETGLAGYPVFTRKVNTDVAYLAAARALLARPDCFLSAPRPTMPTITSRNSHACGDRPYEFQRLYGMGEALHSEVVRPESVGKPCRIYAPVGHAISSPISCGGFWKTAPTPPLSTGWPTTQPRSRRSSPIRSRRRQLCPRRPIR